MGSASAGNDYGAPAPSHPFDAYSIRGYSGCKRSPTGRPGGLRTRSGAITISTLFTAAMPLSHDWQRTSHCSTRKRRRLGVRLLQLFHVTRSLRGFKRSKCQRFALASHPPAETSFSPSLHERSRNAPSSHGVVAAQFFWHTKRSSCSCSCHNATPFSEKKTKSMHRTLFRPTFERRTKFSL